jgi:DNA replication and repair protein RecF
LTNFRNYRRLELELPPHLILLQGDNAQGKTNLLEALYFLATGRSPRTANERELFRQPAEEVPFARLAAEATCIRGSLRVEVSLQGEPSPLAEGARGVRKRVRINGVVRRAADLVGRLNVVLFSPGDIDLIAGPPALRRRYLDLSSSRSDARYLRSLQHYQHVLFQRNHLLRLIGEGKSRVEQLEYWDRELVEAGAYLILRRHQIVAELGSLAEEVHHTLTAGQERLELIYLPSIGGESQQQEEVVQEFRQALERSREREINLGMTLVGPHRDNLRFLGNGRDIAVYGSRGQQRTIAVSLRLAEVKFLEQKTGEPPVLLLDEVLSELDQERRSSVQQFLFSQEQVLVTTTDLERFEPSFLSAARCFQVKGGSITPVEQPPADRREV